MLFQLLQSDTVATVMDSLIQETAPVAAPAAPVQPTEMSESLFSMFTMGGPLMWVLLALSILAIYLIGRKWWMI